MIIYKLVNKKSGKYRLTSFGELVFDWHLLLMQAISEDYWNLKALDLLDSTGIPSSGRSKIIDSLLKNEKLRQFMRKK